MIELAIIDCYLKYKLFKYPVMICVNVLLLLIV